MSFNPKTQYKISEDVINICDFHKYAEDYITRPPYQRKNVWSVKKKQALLDSLFRRYYIPKIVIREVRLSDSRTVREIIDGQQRIITIQDFFDNKLRLPKSLADIGNDNLAGKYFKDLNVDLRRFVDRELRYLADVIYDIDDPRNPLHQKIATEIFWRLQQGVQLNFIEIAHAKLASIARNFIVKYADDISFDFDEYRPINENPSKHNFFRIINTDNSRMQHLLLLTRILMVEEKGEFVDLKDLNVTNFIERYEVEEGIGNLSFEKMDFAKRTLGNLNTCYDIFKNDPIIDEKNGVKELSREYVILSFYFLISHLKKYYVVDEAVEKLIHQFLIGYFYPRWSKGADEDTEILVFTTNRQQGVSNLNSRDQIIRHMFFEFLEKEGSEIILKDTKRSFNEAEKIRIYRRDKGLCRMCLDEGKNELEATVSWKDYEADHIIAHVRGGSTTTENAQVLCRYHNSRKGGN